MTNKYETGTYLVLLFDKHGTQIGTEKATNFISARELGREKTKEPPAASFVVTHTLFNSIDNSDPWSCKHED
jgi:hypothetical protein